MRSDMAKVLCEKARNGSAELSHKTGGRINLKNDFDDDFDSGPTHLGMGRDRQDRRKIRDKSWVGNENPIDRYLESSVGRPWNDIYSELCEVFSKAHVRRRLKWFLKYRVARQIVWRDGVMYNLGHWVCRKVDGLYVDPTTGILSVHKEDNSWRAAAAKTKAEGPKHIYWYGTTYFQLETCWRAVCGCSTPRWDDHPNAYDQIKRCQHWNILVPREVWFVVTYRSRAWDEVLAVYTYENATESQRLMYNLNGPGDKFVIRYGDRPNRMENIIPIRRKTANKKELKIIARAFSSARAGEGD